MLIKQEKRNRRHKRIRARISGTALRPRLYAFRSGSHIYAQLIDDDKGKTLACANDLNIKGKKTKSAAASDVGKLIAKKAKELKIEKVVFDRGGYKYHGRIKTLADGAREGGLNF
ncbi:MAG: 50S ribosomal protein L18 [Candidatus Nealsonbacteria bacterium RBG_13_42_11]|uniref:Large ribosomal subunit protein uL18 n=1 Tax=Candidatus Nealsonbacteria bacterium RBG_13_42_11 TaxID=1801663 RepID=A0A1G2DZ38_9BACT|nr:MAG: 50S ribosomal protein L18 [Candidatus Nealsonbacteria bacterium RBG_13_42_11]